MTNDNKMNVGTGAGAAGAFCAIGAGGIGLVAALAAIWSGGVFLILAWITIALAIIGGAGMALSFGMYARQQKQMEKERDEALEAIFDSLGAADLNIPAPAGDGGAMQARMLKAVTDDGGRA